MKKTKFLTIFASLFLIQCKSQPTKVEAPPPPAKAAEANLTEAEALARSNAIGAVKYDLAMELDEKSEVFAVTETIDFGLKGAPQGLFLDLKDGAKIEAFSVNGKTLPATFTNHRLALPAEALKPGSNKVNIVYKQTYSHEGRGLHRFTDPEDKKVYLYSQFEAFDAHQMFACFDQPDLKATMTMKITAPKSWEVITTTRESKKEADNDRLVWSFPETPKISTYLFSLHAGPYAKFESTAGTVPLRLFVRQTLKRFVMTKDWWVPTQAGIKFYGEYFAYPYPFTKYDQIIVPEFNAGAMENVAAVTFSERFIRRGATTYKERESLASVILHEMAHMWFGDLVTMKWWNGLWLNESFATYMAELSLDRVTEFKDAWSTFYSRSKTGAYIEDQLVTTHPVDSTIVDTNSAFSNFDSITYGKGASALKQLNFYLSENVFREGVRYYFKQHAFQNTKLEDFMGALEHSSHLDLASWSSSWLKKAGVDTVEADFDCKDGKITHFALKLQGPDGAPSPRVHRTLVSLLQEREGSIVPLKTENILYEGSRKEVPALKGVKCPTMVYPNEQDQDYVKVRLDPRTLEAAKENLSKIKSSFTRMLFWPNLYSMVRDVALLPSDYLKIVEKNLPEEQDLTIGESILSSLPSVLYYLPQATPEEKQARADQVLVIERLLWKKLNTAKPGSDWQKMALRSLNDVVESDEGRGHTLGLLDGSIKVNGLVIDVDRRWDLIIKLQALGDQRVEPILNAQRLSDKSNRGVQNGLAAEATQPSLEIKQKWLNRIVDQNELSFDQKVEVMRNLFPRRQDDLRSALSDNYFLTLPSLVKTRELGFLSVYTRSLMPATCTTSSVAKLAGFLNENAATLPAPVIKGLKIGHQEDGRCVAIRAKAAVVH